MTALPLSPNQTDIFIALRSFLTTILPAGNAIFQGQISGTTLTVTSITTGTLNLGDSVVGQFIPPGLFIQALGTGTGTTGTYELSQSLTVTSQVMATGVPVLQGQVNRVSESPASDFIVMWPLRRERIETNVDLSADAKFTGTIAGTLMTITYVYHGSISVGSPVYGINIAAGTRVIKLDTGTGGIGTYTISPAQTFGPGVISCGATTYLQPTLVTIQADVHGPNSADNAQVISTLFRDGYAVEQFMENYPAIYPCYADDPKQVPFTNDQEQFENRWIVECVLQANQVVTVGQQYADSITVILKDVDVVYPPT